MIRLYLIIGAVAVALFIALGLYARHEHNKAVSEGLRADSEASRANGLADARAKDSLAAVGSYNKLQDDCRTDMIAAIGKGRAIEKITSSPPRTDGLPDLVTADELRNLTEVH